MIPKNAGGPLRSRGRKEEEEEEKLEGLEGQGGHRPVQGQF